MLKDKFNFKISENHTIGFGTKLGGKIICTCMQRLYIF